jgi:hypothetical protein
VEEQRIDTIVMGSRGLGTIQRYNTIHRWFRSLASDVPRIELSTFAILGHSLTLAEHEIAACIKYSIMEGVVAFSFQLE